MRVCNAKFTDPERFLPNALASTAIQFKRRTHSAKTLWRLRVAVFSSFRLYDATHQLAASIQHWNVYSGSAGLKHHCFGRVACPAVSE